MPQQLILQPDGRFAVFSTIVDAFVFMNGTEEELVAYRRAEAADDAEERCRARIKLLQDGETPSPHFNRSYEEAFDMHRRSCCINNCDNGLGEEKTWIKPYELQPENNEFILATGPQAFTDMAVDICNWDGTLLWDEDGTEMSDHVLGLWRPLPMTGWLDPERYPPPAGKTILIHGKGISNHTDGPPVTLTNIDEEVMDDFLENREWSWGMIARADGWQPVPQLPEHWRSRGRPSVTLDGRVIDWKAVKKFYLRTRSPKQTALAFNLSEHTVKARARQKGWAK